MRIHLSELKRLSVETKSGNVLGKIKDIVFEIDGQLIAQYIVKSSMIGGKEYIINRDQVVNFKDGKMIVDDSVGLKKSLEEKEKRSSS